MKPTNSASQRTKNRLREHSAEGHSLFERPIPNTFSQTNPDGISRRHIEALGDQFCISLGCICRWWGWLPIDELVM